MYRQEDREIEMWKNADHMHSLALMETVLDEQLERLENEYHWNCRKYVYLQALDCEPEHLDHLALSLQRSRRLTEILRSLLEDTFEEKLVFMEKVTKQQQQWQFEDDHNHHDKINEQLQHNTCQNLLVRRCFEKLKKWNNRLDYLRIKQNKQCMISLSKLKTQTTKPKMLIGKRHGYINGSRQRKFSFKLCNMDISELTRARQWVQRTSNAIKTQRHNHYVEVEQNHKHYFTESTQLKEEGRGLQLVKCHQHKTLSDLTNEIINSRQMNCQSLPWLLPSDEQEQMELETFRRIWREEELKHLDIFCLSLGCQQDHDH